MNELLTELHKRAESRSLQINKLTITVNVAAANNKQFMKKMGCGVCLQQRATIFVKTAVNESLEDLVDAVVNKIKMEDVRGVDIMGHVG